MTIPEKERGITSAPRPGPDLFFAGGEALDRHGTLVRHTDQAEDLAAETATRNSDAQAIGRDGVLRTWEIDNPRVEWLNEVDLDPLRNVLTSSDIGDISGGWAVNNAASAEQGDLPAGEKAYLVSSELAAAESRVEALPFVPIPATATFSVVVKRRAADWVFLLAYSGTDGTRQWFDLKNVAVGTAIDFGAGYTATDASIEAIGSNLLRISMTVTTPGENGSVGIGLANGDGDTDSALDLTVQTRKAQLEDGATPTPYQAAPDNRDTDRKFPSLLLEAAAENGWSWSEQLDNAAWTKVRATVVANAVVAPDGGSGGDRLAEDASVTTDHYFLRDTPTLTDNTRTTISVFAKAQNRSEILLGMRIKNGNVRQVWFDLESGSIGSSVGGGDPQPTMRDYGDGWYRCSISPDAEAGATVPRVECRLGSGGETSVYTGDGTSGVNFWGMQVEADSSAPSSYQATEGVAVTRAADLFSGPYPHPPQGMTVYMKGQERASFGGGTVYQWQIGTNTPAFFLQVFSDRFRLFLNNGVTTTSSESATGFPTQDIPPGTLAEYVCQLYGDGSVQLRVTVGGVETVMPRSAAIGLPAEWAGPALWVNSRSQGSHSSMAHLAVKAHRGVRSLDFMRGL